MKWRELILLIVVSVVVIRTLSGGYDHTRGIWGYKKCAEVQPMLRAKYVDELGFGIYDHVTCPISKIVIFGCSKIPWLSGFVKFIEFGLGEHHIYNLRGVWGNHPGSINGAGTIFIDEIWRSPINFVIHNKFGMNDPGWSLTDIVDRNWNRNWDNIHKGHIFWKLSSTGGKTNPSSLVGPHLGKLLPENQTGEYGDYDAYESKYRHYPLKDDHLLPDPREPHFAPHILVFVIGLILGGIGLLLVVSGATSWEIIVGFISLAVGGSMMAHGAYPLI
jgi:hypothetical protein